MRTFVFLSMLIGIILLVLYNFFNPYDRHHQIVGFISFIVSSVGFLIAWHFFNCKKTESLCIAAVLLIVSTVLWKISAPSSTRLAELARPTVEALEVYKKSYGRYPTSLAELTVTYPQTRYGNLFYEVDSGGQTYSIRIADYGKDLFQVICTSNEKSWFEDY